MENLSPEAVSLLDINDIEMKKSAASDLVNHIFKSLKALRELSQCGMSSYHSDLVLSTLTAGASNLAKGIYVVVERLLIITSCDNTEMVSSTDGFNHILCPAHGKMEIVHFGSDRHAHLLDHVYKIRIQKKYVSCRQCERLSLSHDLNFFHCPTCHYTRCIFCTPCSSIPWDTVKALLEACPSACEHVYPGGRLLLHEIVPRQEALEVLKIYLSINIAGVRVMDTSGELPIHWAALCGSGVNILQTLVTAYPESVRLSNRDKKLPLHMAIQSCHTDAVRYLLELYPDGGKAADALGWTPLHYAVNSQADPVPSILDMCLGAYPEGCGQPNHQGYFPLHLYIRSRATPSSWVIKKLLMQYPFAAFVTTGEQDELPLHTLAARSPPCPRCVQALVDVNPEGALQMSKETSWAEASSPLSIAVAAVYRREDSKENVALENYWEVGCPVLFATYWCPAMHMSCSSLR